MRIDTDSLGQTTQSSSSKRPYSGDFAAMLYDGRLSTQELAARQAAVDAIRAKGSVWASSSVASGGAKGFLASLNAQDLALLQQAKGLASTINVAALSEEGATNLLVDHAAQVDLNNDGIVEVGIGKMMMFPPPNAPQAAKDAWEAATAGMSDSDRMSLSGHIGLPLLLAGNGNGVPSMGDLASEEFDWGNLIDRLLQGIEVNRAYNKPAQMDMLEAGVRRFGEELRARGLG
jgi:hypothetical protein